MGAHCVQFVRENSQVLFTYGDYIHCMQSQGVVSTDYNKSTTGADASVEALKPEAIRHEATYLSLLSSAT